MSDHNHREFVEGCHRCDLSREEVRRGEFDEIERLARRLRDRGFPKLAPVVRSDLVLRAADALEALIERVRQAEAERDEGWRVAAEQTRLERARAERAEAVIAEVECLADETDVETHEATQAWLVGNLRAAIDRYRNGEIQ